MAKKKEKPIDLLRQQLREFKRAGGILPPAYGVESCYVCKRKAHARDLKYIGKRTNADGIEEGVYRHEQCEAGSSSWFRHMPNSSVRKYFVTPDGSGGQGNGKD